jgi:hypothetical protein
MKSVVEELNEASDDVESAIEWARRGDHNQVLAYIEGARSALRRAEHELAEEEDG